VTEPTRPDEPFDPTADTGRFEAFAQGDDEDLDDRGPAVGAPFRIVTLVAGLLVLGILVVVLLLL